MYAPDFAASVVNFFTWVASSFTVSVTLSLTLSDILMVRLVVVESINGVGSRVRIFVEGVQILGISHACYVTFACSKKSNFTSLLK